MFKQLKGSVTAGAVALALVAPTAAQAAPAPAMAWSPTTAPAAFEYGMVASGQTATQAFTLTNSGASATGALSVSLTGSSAFSIIGNTCTATALGPGKPCVVTVEYTPAGADDSATLTAVGKKPVASTSLTLSGSPLTPLAACQQALAAAGYSEPENANYILGTAGNDDFTALLTSGSDVICGFAGDDATTIATRQIELGDIFLGGDGNDQVFEIRGGAIFDGGAGNDTAQYLRGGTFNGGDGDDVVVSSLGGTFNGGAGDDVVGTAYGVTFNGGAGNDRVSTLAAGTFNGGDGDDFVDEISGGVVSSEATFNGEDGCDGYGSIGANGTFNPGDQSTCLP